MLCSLFIFFLTSFELCIFFNDSILSPCWFISSRGCTMASPGWASEKSPPSLSSGTFLTCTHWSVFLAGQEEGLSQIPGALSPCSLLLPLLCLENLPTLPLHVPSPYSLTKGDFQALPALTIPVPQPGNSAGSYSAQHLSFSSLGNYFPLFSDIPCLQNCFFIYFIQLFFFIVSGRRINSVPFTPS